MSKGKREKMVNVVFIDDTQELVDGKRLQFLLGIKDYQKQVKDFWWQ